MSKNEQLNVIERLENIEKDINKAEVELSIHTRQLKDLIPAKKKMEEESMEKFGKEINELMDYKTELENNLLVLVDKIETEIKDIKGEQVDD